MRFSFTTALQHCSGRRTECVCRNSSDVPIALWFDGGGPIKLVPRSSSCSFPLPKHVHDHPHVSWSATTADADALLIASGRFDNSQVKQAPQVVLKVMPQINIAYLKLVVELQRRIRERVRRAVSERRALEARRHAAAATTIQTSCRGILARRSSRCYACIAEMPASSMIAVARDCREHAHRICRPCARKYVDYALADGKLFIKCPGEACRVLLKPSCIHAVGSAGAVERHTQQMAESHSHRLRGEGDAAFLQFAQEHVRTCTACGVLIFRYEGCNHMTCRCGNEFDWNEAAAQVRRPAESATPRGWPANLIGSAAFGEFNPEDSSHSEALQALWDAAFPDELPRLLVARRRHSKRWAELGFQGRDPTTDLRASGMMGLRDLRAYVEARVAEVGALAMLEGASTFPLAIASINCTALLQSYLDLNPSV